jgi:hypothetical protein
MGKERVAFERLDDGDDSVMAADSKVVALGNVMGKNNSRSLADSRENCE